MISLAGVDSGPRSRWRTAPTRHTVPALAERLRTEIVITLDHRHFGVVRPRHCERLRLLP
jgi:hypothetical protein